MGTLTVSEIFGPTVQGEGPSQGRRCGFVRLGRCNLDCAWCDTPFTWDWSGKNGVPYDPATELVVMPVEDVADRVKAMGVGLLVVSGGEPLIQQNRLPALFDLLPDVQVEVETNGTRKPTAEMTGRVRYNVSPKLANSGVPHDRRIVPEALAALNVPGTAWKFVCRTERCLDEVDNIVGEYGLDPSAVWVMPEGRTVTELDRHLGNVADRAVTTGYNLTGRLHVTVWGDTKGK